VARFPRHAARYYIHPIQSVQIEVLARESGVIRSSALLHGEFTGIRSRAQRQDCEHRDQAGDEELAAEAG
jgi:hypothetical protein